MLATLRRLGPEHELLVADDGVDSRGAWDAMAPGEVAAVEDCR